MYDAGIVLFNIYVVYYENKICGYIIANTPYFLFVFGPVFYYANITNSERG